MPKPNVSAAESLAIDTQLVSELLGGFVRDEVTKVGFSDVVIGISGGVDSAVTTAIAVGALGAEHVHGLLMPYRTSSSDSVADAQLVCERFGVKPEIVDISQQIDAYFAGDPEASRARRGNKMARERMSVLYDVSFARNAMVVGTSNKSELLLGYSTIHGDAAYAINPIGDLYKTQVFSLAEHLDVPEPVRVKPPSADLWEGQTDEDDLGFTYATVDALLFALVDERRTPVELYDLGFDQQLVQKVIDRVQNSQYKRRPPLIAKVGNRTIEREFRYPRDWGR